MELMMLVFSTICCELRHVYRTWGREETVNWITQWVIELRSCWTWKANCQCVWADEYHRSSVQLSTWVFPRLIRATFTPNCDNHEKLVCSVILGQTQSFSLVCFGKGQFSITRLESPFHPKTQKERLCRVFTLQWDQTLTTGCQVWKFSLRISSCY